MRFNLPVILLKGTVLMPENEIKLELIDELSKNIIDEAEFFHDNKVLVVTQSSLEENILLTDLPRIGTLATITRKLELPNDKIRVVLKGIKRLYVVDYLNPKNETFESIVSNINIDDSDDKLKNITIKKLYTELKNCIDKVPSLSNSVLTLISDLNDLNKITDIIVNHIVDDPKRIFQYLLEINVYSRVQMLLEDIYEIEQLFNIEKNIETRVKKKLDKEEKNFYLKEKIKLYKNELGDLSVKEEEIDILKEKLNNLHLSDDIHKKVLYEINRYDEMSNMSPEISLIRNYIDTMLNLPWNNMTLDITDFNLIKGNLDKTHFKLNEVKDRILEYLAVKQESKNVNSPIICLVGPPGVGKTTLAYSISKSIGRNFVKISVGGVDDESIIKGHIRTYIGATPGKIIDGIRRAKSMNPVFLIDEIDKMVNNYKGDPASALLEVLDNNQNKYFKDNYIEEEFDLSNVLFITTANDVEMIPMALRDRLEIINIEGYTELEKLEITKNYIIPVICRQHGIKEIKISDENILNIIKYYTKESGLRELERTISKIVRKLITNKIINKKRISYTINNIEMYLGNKIYETNIITNDIGVVNGLACTTYGGDIIPIEVNYYKGNGNLIMTGSLGEVMLESAKISLSYIKSNYQEFGINYDIFKNDIHINIPNIAVKKEGPSAGVAITTCLISALSNLKISSKIAMTGEITLRGNVLKIGGLKEKIIGAYINNIDTVFIPYSNINDLQNIPDEIKNKIKFIIVRDYIDIYNYIKGV